MMRISRVIWGTAALAFSLAAVTAFVLLLASFSGHPPNIGLGHVTVLVLFAAVPAFFILSVLSLLFVFRK